MRRRWIRLVPILFALCSAGAVQPDTARLAAHLARFRPYKVYEMSAIEHGSIQSEYLAWIDFRMKTGRSAEQMNQELESAGLLSNGPETVDDMFDKTYAGLLGKIEIKRVRPADDLLAVKFGIHTGGHCNFDETVALYTRIPFRRVERINAEQSYTHGYRLREVAVGRDDRSRGRTIASAWVASNCTSNWNGNIFRIDSARAQSTKSVLYQSVSVFGGEPVNIALEGDTVAFRYTSAMLDTTALTRAGIARYRVQDGDALRQAPVAESFGGFISEWLMMDEADAARWSAPEAAVHHHDLAAPLKIFEWEHVAACPGSPPEREIAVRWIESRKTTVFLISGSSAAEMRILSISDQRSASCQEIDIGSDLRSIFSEPSR